MVDAGGVLERQVRGLLAESLQASRVVYLNGPRQAGKTTLVRQIADDVGAEYLTLDDRVSRAFAEDDPDGFVDRARPTVIDEVQRGGNALLLAIKAAVDRDPQPGQFLLTGSTRFLTVPDISESLAGRVDLIDLWPLSQAEIEARPETFINRLFGATRSLRRARPTPASRAEVFERVCRGGFPEAVRRRGRQRSRWFNAYLRTIAERDVGELANVQRVADLPALIRLLATRTSAELNVSSLANDADIPRTTLTGYVPLLEAVFLVYRLPAWSRNLTSKRVKQAKVHFTDSGLAAHLVGAVPNTLDRPDAPMAGALLETFVVGEIARQLASSSIDAELHHFRDRAGAEVDLVVEASDGRVAAIEIKAGRSVGRSDVRSSSLLRDRIGDEFVNGVVLNCGDAVQALGDRLTAIPISTLWS